MTVKELMSVLSSLSVMGPDSEVRINAHYGMWEIVDVEIAKEGDKWMILIEPRELA